MNEKLKIFGKNGENRSQVNSSVTKNVKDPKLSKGQRSMPIEKLGSSSLVSSIFQREGKLHCSLTGRKI